MPSTWKHHSLASDNRADSKRSAPQVFREDEPLRQPSGRWRSERDVVLKQLADSREENRRLREAAFLWISLYERQVTRANQLARVRSA